MQLSRFVRTLGLVLVLGLPGFGGGCGPDSAPLAPEDSQKLQKSHKGVHQQLKETHKAVAQKIQEQKQKQGALRKSGHRGAGVQ
jgi:hypothetical protein